MLSFVLAACVATSYGACPETTCVEPDSSSRAALHAALDAFGAAFREADVEALDTLLTVSYMHTNGSSGQVLTKDEWLEFVRRRRADLRSGRLQIHRYETSGVAIRWCSGAAIVSSQVASSGKNNGQSFESRLRVTQLWLRLGTRWRRAAFHDSPLPDVP
jgi:hypothetical protein